MELARIKIRKSFTEHPPKEKKLEDCREYYEIHGKIDRPIVIDENDVLIDGYVGYLVLTENGISEYPVKVDTPRKLMLTGYHKGNDKPYRWTIDENTKGFVEGEHYTKAIVETARGNKTVDVASICLLADEEEVCRKRVIRLYVK